MTKQMSVTMFLVLLLAAVAVLLLPLKAKAAEPTDVKRVVELMHSGASNVLSGKTFDDNDVQIIFVVRGLRYTFYHSVEEGSLSVWRRPEGTGGQKNILTFTDYGLDGQVDGGVKGKAGTDSEKQLLYVTDRETKGEEFHPYWQGLYDQAIKDALRTLKAKPRGHAR